MRILISALFVLSVALAGPGANAQQDRFPSQALVPQHYLRSFAFPKPQTPVSPYRPAAPYLSAVGTRPTVRIMAPDRMPCLVPHSSTLEKMPVRGRQPGDPINK